MAEFKVTTNLKGYNKFKNTALVAILQNGGL